jgi:hypothetical protein
MTRSLPIAMLLVVAVSTGCSVRKIPGTEIDDNVDTRAILSVIDAYRKAVESKNTQTLTDLADESFKDDSGSSTPDDDHDYKSLNTKLRGELSRVEDLRLDLNVRKIDVDKALDIATATYTYTISFRMPTLSAVSKSEADIKQMHLRRVKDHTWKIVSGI